MMTRRRREGSGTKGTVVHSKCTPIARMPREIVADTTKQLSSDHRSRILDRSLGHGCALGCVSLLVGNQAALVWWLYIFTPRLSFGHRLRAGVILELIDQLANVAFFARYVGRWRQEI